MILLCAVRQRLIDCFTEKAKMFGDQLKDFSSSLFVVLNNCLKINEYKHDPEVTSELFYQTSVSGHVLCKS